MSDSVRPHRRQPTRLPHPWDSPGKHIGVGCHFLLPCMKVKSESEVAQSCPTLHDPMDCSPPGSSIHGIFEARVLEWGAFAFSKLGVSGDCKDHSTKSLRSQEGVPQKKPRATTKTQAAASLDVRMGVLSSLTLLWNSSLGNH